MVLVSRPSEDILTSHLGLVSDKMLNVLVSSEDVLFLALDWKRIGLRLFKLWHTASLYFVT